MSKPTGVISIHGREYTTVAKRVQDFRAKYPDWPIRTSILHRDDDLVIIKAEILCPFTYSEGGDGTMASLEVVATGHAEEWRKSSQINKTSAVENAETSAIGRALACLGYGGTEFASANEIDIAKAKEKTESPYEKHSARQTAVDEFESLPEDAQAIVREWALEIIACVQEGNLEAALAVAENAESHEDKLALWSQLDSKTRSALKKAKQPALASQP